MDGRKLRRIGYLLSVGLAGSAFYFPLCAAVFTTVGVSADFIGYNPFVRYILEHGSVSRPNFLYPLIVAGISSLFPSIDLLTLQLWITLSFYLLLAGILMWILEREMGDPKTFVGVSVRIVAVLVIMSIGPINFLPLHGNHVYFGYISPNVYHNANIALVKPLALLHAYVLARYLRNPEEIAPVTRSLLLPILLALATLAKPNYALILLPAVALLFVIARFRNEPFPILSVLVTVFAPAILILAWQYSFTYANSDPGSVPTSVVFWPFVAYRAHSLQLIPKLFLSIAFPASVIILFWQRIRTNLLFLFSALLFVFGLIFTYGFAETGPHLADMNFAWSGQISIFILVLACVLQCIQKYRETQRIGWRLLIVVSVFAMHIAGGILWYYRETSASGVYW